MIFYHYRTDRKALKDNASLLEDVRPSRIGDLTEEPDLNGLIEILKKIR